MMNSVFQRAVVATLATGILTSPALAADWPQFHGPNRNGISEETGLLREWPETGPKEVWSVPVGKGYGAASIMGGEVFFLDREEDARDVVRCLSLADGKELWRYAYEAPGSVGHSGSRNPPTVDEKYVYTVGMMGHFTCTDRAAHTPVWQKDLQAEFGAPLGSWGFAQSPVLYKNMAIINVQAADAFTVAFDRATGNVVWKSPGCGGAGYVSPLVTTLAGQEQVVALSTDGACGFSIEDGALLWNYDGWESKIPIPHPTPLGDDKLLISSGYDAGSAIIQIKKDGDAFSAEEVKKIEAQTMGVQIQQPIVYNDLVFVGNNSNERELGFCCFTKDGEQKWCTGEGQMGLERGPFIIADGMLILLDGKEGTLHLAEPSGDGYKEIDQAKVLDGKTLWAPLALADGKLVLRSQDVMKCLDLKNP